MIINELGPLGAEVINADLKKINKDQQENIKKSFLEFSVLVFRNQSLKPDELK